MAECLDSRDLTPFLLLEPLLQKASGDKVVVKDQCTTSSTLHSPSLCRGGPAPTRRSAAILRSRLGLQGPGCTVDLSPAARRMPVQVTLSEEWPSLQEPR